MPDSSAATLWKSNTAPRRCLSSALLFNSSGLLVMRLSTRVQVASSWGCTRPRRKEVSVGSSSSESGAVGLMAASLAKRLFFMFLPVLPILTELNGMKNRE